MVQKLLYTLTEKAEMIWGEGSRTEVRRIQKMLNEGALEGTKIGTRTFVPLKEINKFKTTVRGE